MSRLLSEKADFTDRIVPLAAAISLHTPCSLKNVMREEQGASELLRQIPELKIAKLSQQRMLRSSRQLCLETP